MNLGFSEMLFIFLLALIIFGPKKLPEIGRQVGKALAEFKRASNEFKSQLETEMRQIEIEEMLRKEKDTLAQAITPAADTLTEGSLGLGEPRGNVLPPPSDALPGAGAASELVSSSVSATGDSADTPPSIAVPATTRDVAANPAVSEPSQSAADGSPSQPVAAAANDHVTDGPIATQTVAVPALNIPAEVLAKSDVVKGSDA